MMWSRQLFIVWFLALTILATQSHVIHKRGLISRLFGGNSKSNRDVERDLPVRERSRFRKLLKNPVVIAMIGAAAGMIIQKALAKRNMNEVCDNKYIKMALTAGNLDPHLQQIINSLGCNKKNRSYDSSTISYNKFSNTSNTNRLNTTLSPFADNDNDNDQNDEDTLQSHFPPERESRIQQLLSIFRGEKGAKRNFIKSLFGFNKKAKTFKQGQKLPSSSYKLDKDDADSLKELENELEQFNKAIH